MMMGIEFQHEKMKNYLEPFFPFEDFSMSLLFKRCQVIRKIYQRVDLNLPYYENEASFIFLSLKENCRNQIEKLVFVLCFNTFQMR